MNRSKIYIAVIISGAILLSLIVLLPASSLHSSTTGISISMSQTPLSAPFIVAKHIGAFQSHGLDVELIPCIGGVRCAHSMLSGKSQFATASESVVMFESFNKPDIRLLVSFVESSNDLKLITLNSALITSIPQLQGKKIGVIKGSASEFYLDSQLLASRLTSISVEKVYMEPNQLNQALINGKVDAISVWEPCGYQLSQQVSEPVVNLGIDGVYQLSFNLLSTQSTLEQIPEASLKGLLQSLALAIDWINQHPEAAQNLLATHLGVEVAQLRWSWDDYLFRLSIGNALLTNLQLQARWAIKNNIRQGEMPAYRNIVDDYVYDSLIDSGKLK